MGKYLIVGCGLSGSVIGRELAEDGHDITIWDRRDHIGGNMYDYLDEHGIIVHKYGPHCFHTNNKALYDYMCRYNQWRPFRIFCQAEIMVKQRHRHSISRRLMIFIQKMMRKNSKMR